MTMKQVYPTHSPSGLVTPLENFLFTWFRLAIFICGVPFSFVIDSCSSQISNFTPSLHKNNF